MSMYDQFEDIGVLSRFNLMM